MRKFELIDEDDEEEDGSEIESQDIKLSIGPTFDDENQWVAHSRKKMVGSAKEGSIEMKSI